MKKILFLLLLVISVYPTFAQEEENIENIFQGPRIVNGQSANLAPRGKLQLLVQHRFGEIGGGFYDLFGLDQAAMRLGFEYGFENITVGIGRSSFLKTYDAYGKVRLAQQSTSFPLTMVATIGGSIPTIRNYYPSEHNNFGDKSSGNIELHLAKTIGFAGFQISPGYLSTGYLPAENQNFSLFTLGLAGSVKISRKVSANVEYLSHFNSDIQSAKPLSFGVDVDTGGHVFQLIISNSQRMFTQGIYTNSFGNWADGKIYFGFNLIREFRIKYY